MACSAGDHFTTQESAVVIRLAVETGADFSENVGDEAYFASMADLFRERFGEDVEITKFANRPEFIARRYGVKAVYSGSDPLRGLRGLWQTFRAIASCDAYVWGGGQMPNDAHGIHSPPYRFVRPMLAKLLGKPVISYAIGAGPLTMSVSRQIVRRCMSRYDVVTVRDPYSVALLKEIGVSRPIHETLDAAIILKAASQARVREILAAENVPQDRPLLVYVPWGPAYRCHRGWVPVIFRRRRSREEKGPGYAVHVRSVAAALDSMIERHGVSVLMVAMDCSVGHGSDDQVGRDIVAAMRARDQAVILKGEYSPKEVKGITGAAALVAGSRMHGLILATGESVPTCGVCFTEKIRQFARLTGQDHHYIDVDEANTGDRLFRTLEAAYLDRHASSERIRAWLPEARATIVANVERLARLVETREDLRRRAGRCNVSRVVKGNLCTMCGTCYALCPHDRIRIVSNANGEPTLSVKTGSVCARCGLCVRICPGASIDIARIKRELFGQEPGDAMVGSFQRIILTRARDGEVHARGASGGTVSALTRHLLASGTVDSVLVTGMGTREDPTEPFSLLASDVGALERCSGSVYELHAVNAALKDMKEGQRIAVVGLGCHVQGVRKAALEVPRLRENVGPVIGLFCGHNANSQLVDHLLGRLGVGRRNLRSFRFRDGGFPGGLEAIDLWGKKHSIGMGSWTYALTLFQSWRCAVCTDPLNVLADVAVGDAWLPELRAEGGWNITIVRSDRGRKLIERAQAAGVIDVRESSRDDVVRSQKALVHKRMYSVASRARICKWLGLPAPDDERIQHGRATPRNLAVEGANMLVQVPFSVRTVARFLDPLVDVIRLIDRLSRKRRKAMYGGADTWYDEMFH